jgi:hypothetical protein
MIKLYIVIYQYKGSETVNKRYRISKGQSEMDNPEKLTLAHNTKKNKQKRTQYVLDNTMRKQIQIT